MCELALGKKRYILGGFRQAYALLKEFEAALGIQFATIRDEFGDVIILCNGKRIGHIARI